MDPNSYAIKTNSVDLARGSVQFKNEKTMYGGKHISKGDVIFIFSREDEASHALVARGLVARANATAKTPGIDRQTPRVTIQIERCVFAVRKLGKSELLQYSNWTDGAPETEINFKLYRQSTNKIVGLSEEVAKYLDSFF